MIWAYFGVTMAFLAYHVVRYARATPRAAITVDRWTPPREAPLISFLVPAWNAVEDLPPFVAAFRDLSYPRKELILAAGGEDGSYAQATRFEADDVLVLEQQPGEGKQGALQRSYLRSTGEILYLTDIDCRPSDLVVNALLRQLVENGEQVATGPSRPLDSQLDDPLVRVQWAVDLATQPQRSEPVTGLLGRNAALTREAVAASGDFATPAPSGTDYTLAKELVKSGFDIRFVPGAPMPTEYPTRFTTRIQKQARWIRNVVLIGRRYGAGSEVRAALLTVMIPIVIAGLALAAALGLRPAGFLAVLLVAHAIGNGFRYLKLAGLRAGPAAVAYDVLSRQTAAIRAGLGVLRGTTTW